MIRARDNVIEGECRQVRGKLESGENGEMEGELNGQSHLAIIRAQAKTVHGDR